MIRIYGATIYDFFLESKYVLYINRNPPLSFPPPTPTGIAGVRSSTYHIICMKLSNIFKQHLQSRSPRSFTRTSPISQQGSPLLPRIRFTTSANAFPAPVTASICFSLALLLVLPGPLQNPPVVDEHFAPYC